MSECRAGFLLSWICRNKEGVANMNSTKQSVSALCPDCGHEIRLGPNPHKHEKFSCPNCWAYLEVVNLNPVELAWENVDENEDSDFDWADED
jgi:lysine biosynthesis protein LysW